MFACAAARVCLCACMLLELSSNRILRFIDTFFITITITIIIIIIIIKPKCVASSLLGTYMCAEKAHGVVLSIACAADASQST